MASPNIRLAKTDAMEAQSVKSVSLRNALKFCAKGNKTLR